MREVLVFDVNETLLDLDALQPLFMESFGDRSVMAEWFGLMLRLSLVATITRTYRPFDVLGREALEATARNHQLSLDSAVYEAIIHQLLNLPPHPDVEPALTRLQEAGYRLAALTNSAPAALASQMKASGLGKFFERTMSVEAVRLFKPAPETYQYAARQLKIPISQMRLVAAHDWDVLGALRAGAKAVFIARKGKTLGNSAEIPDLITPDLKEMAHELLNSQSQMN